MDSRGALCQVVDVIVVAGTSPQPTGPVKGLTKRKCLALNDSTLIYVVPVTLRVAVCADLGRERLPKGGANE